MPKLSFAQEMYEMEHVVAAARSNVGLLPDPDLALTLADKLAAITAEIKELKTRQQSLLAAQKVKTEEMAVLVHRGTWVARRLRAYIVLVLGTKHAQLTQFGIRLRRRPRRKAHTASADVAGRLAEVSERLAAVRDDRPEAHRSRAIVRHDGAIVPEVGGTVLRLGGEDFGIGADVAGVGAAAPPERGAVSLSGGTAAGDRAIVPENRADAKRRGAIVPETRGAAARAA
jgi:hypothetical protein